MLRSFLKKEDFYICAITGFSRTCGIISCPDVVCDSTCMTGTCDPFKMSGFSVMQSSLCFSNVGILAIPTTSLIYHFEILCCYTTWGQISVYQ